MSALRTSVLAALAAALFPLFAAAQSSGPRLLIPLPGTEAPKTPGSGEATTPRAATDGDGAEAGTTGGIRVETLSRIGASATGLLTEAEGGLPATLWRGSDPAVIGALFARLPDTWSSRAARRLARRLLLSAGPPPGNPAADTDLLAARLRRLVAMGDADAVVQLAEAAAAVSSGDAAIARPYVEALLLKNQVEQACGLVAAQVRQGGTDFWQRASVFCDLQAGRRTEADLTRAILADTGRTDPGFAELADSLADGTPAKLADAGDLTPLTVTMFALAGNATLTDPGTPAPPVAAVLATIPRLKTIHRVAFGEQAAAAGTMPPAPVILAYGEKDADLSASVLRAPVSAAAQAATNTARAEAMLAAWNAGTGAGQQSLVAGMCRGLLDRTPAATELAFLGGPALRMQILNGDTEGARGWLDLLRRRAAAGDGPSALAQTAAIPLAVVSGLDPVNERRLAIWRDATRDEANGDARWLRLLLLLDALGMPAADSAWAELLPHDDLAGAGTGAVLWRQLVMSAGGNRTGETVLAVLAMVGRQGPGGLDPVTLSTVVGALRRVGLAEDARQIAAEALIAAGE
ncbi:MAG: hypothetical protein VYB54_08960 [Pseudomonadota bacterium]|nr:hypothetical protein [Pseudomonadota bacterium]